MRYGKPRSCKIRSAFAVSFSCSSSEFSGKDKFDQFDFFKLMLANQPARIAPVTSRFRAKTRRVSRVIFRQILCFENFFGVIIRHRNFGGRNQRKSAFVLDMKQIFLEFRQLIRPEKRFAVDHKRRQSFRVAVFGRVNVEHKIDQRAFEPRARAVQNRKARTRDFVARSKSKMPNASPKSTWSFTSKSNSFGSPHLRISTFADSSAPTGTPSAGIFGKSGKQLAHRVFGFVALLFEFGLFFL